MKPKLYLHCGMYKTGSSFLQTMFVRNRDLLNNSGIHYPKSEHELEMKEGRITAGNGVHLSEILTQKETDIAKFLSEDLATSKRMDLNAILYSSEMLFHRFYEKETVQKLQSAAKAAGFGKISALLYFRDPLSHTLSTYKHRAKFGDHQNFRKWLQDRYEIFEQAEAFLNYSKSSEIEWTCRRYDSDSVHMVTSSFADWLGTEIPEIPQDDRINRSLQLNEIRVLQSLKIKYHGCEDFVREALLSLRPEEKESDKSLKELYSYIVAEKWCKHKTMLNSLNQLLNEDEKLTIKPVNRPDENVPYVVLSEKQVEAIAEGMDNYLQSQKLYFKLSDILKRGLKKIKRVYLSSNISYKS